MSIALISDLTLYIGNLSNVPSNIYTHIHKFPRTHIENKLCLEAHNEKNTKSNIHIISNTQRSTIHMYDRSLFVVGANLWCSLPKHLQRTDDITILSKEVKEWLSSA